MEHHDPGHPRNRQIPCHPEQEPQNRPGLVFAGEVEVDIGRFIAFEPEERLEGNVVAVPPHGRPALGAVLR